MGEARARPCASPLKGGAAVPEKKVSWFENFWYHYKIPAILVAAAIVFAVVVGVQIATRQNYDLYVLYAGSANVNDTSAGVAPAKQMELAFRELTGDGELKTAVQSFVWVNDSLAAEYRKNDVAVNATQNTKAFRTVMDAVSSGKCSIMLLDREIFNEVRDRGALEKLSDVLGREAEGAIDEYGVLLCDTPFGRETEGFRDLPEDTVLCVRNLQNGFSLIGKSTGGEKWDRQIEIFRKMMDYGRNTGEE